MKKIIHFLLFTLLICSVACKKPKIEEDPHNHSLLKKTLPEIKAAIAGNWQINRYHYYACGIVSCTTKDSVYNGTGDIISFLPNDTVRRVAYTGSPTYIYEKALIEKVKVYDYGPNGFPNDTDSAYKYEMVNGFIVYYMKEIKNDSLVIDADFYTYYLTRK